MMSIASHLLCSLAPPDLPQQLTSRLPGSPRALARVVFDPTVNEHGINPNPDRTERLALLLGAALSSRDIKLIVERHAVLTLVEEIGSEARHFALAHAETPGDSALPSAGQRKAALKAAGYRLLASFARTYGLMHLLPALPDEKDIDAQPEWLPAHDRLLVAALGGFER